MIFIDNKYTTIYFRIVERAKLRQQLDVYHEKHHIIPECFYKNRSRKGPSGWLDGNPNDSSNIVRLTAKEHFICHILLTKMTADNAKHKMILAVIGMKRSSTKQRYFNSRSYELVRRGCQEIFSNINLGRKHTSDTKAKVARAATGRVQSEETKKKRSETMLAKFRTPDKLAEKERIEKEKDSKPKYQKPVDFGKKISNALKGLKRRPMSDETKNKLSVLNTGRPSPNKGNRYQLTPEQKAKISENNKKRVYTDETRAKIAAGVKAANAKRLNFG
jgi:hypothetical protein